MLFFFTKYEKPSQTLWLKFAFDKIKIEFLFNFYSVTETDLWSSAGVIYTMYLIPRIALYFEYEYCIFKTRLILTHPCVKYAQLQQNASYMFMHQ